MPLRQHQESMTISMAGFNLEAKWDRQAAVDLAARQAIILGGPRSYEDYRAEKFIVSAKNESAFNAAVGFDRHKENLFFCGPVGSGKSHLSAVAARKVLEERNWEARLQVTNQMEISRIMRSQTEPDGEQDFIDTCVGMNVFVLEDLGVAKDTDFLISTLYEIINGRYQQKSGGLIITSNLNLGQIAEKLHDDRISSRLSQMCAGHIYNLNGELDHRVPEKKL